MIVDPGAVFVGIMKNSPTNSIGAMELATGTTPGTLAGFGTSFVNFGTVTVDAGAIWSVSGLATVGSGMTLTVDGTLALAGALDDQGDVIFGPGGVLTTPMTIDNKGTVEFTGAVGAGSMVGFAGVGTLVIDDLASAPGGMQQQDFDAPITGFVFGEDLIRVSTARLGNFGGIDGARPAASTAARRR